MRPFGPLPGRARRGWGACISPHSHRLAIFSPSKQAGLDSQPVINHCVIIDSDPQKLPCRRHCSPRYLSSPSIPQLLLCGQQLRILLPVSPYRAVLHLPVLRAHGYPQPLPD